MRARRTLPDRLFGALVRLLPEEFRAGYAREMEATFHAERRDAGAAGRPSALARLWLATAGDILRAAPAEHLDILERDTHELVSASLGTRRFAPRLLTAFAATALVLAVVGLYGALGVVVGQRRREIGVRIALGARAEAIGGIVLAQGMRPVAGGLLIGLGLAALCVGALRSMLYEVRSLDPATFAGAAAVLLASSAVACLVPAWRAARIDPATVLREG